MIKQHHLRRLFHVKSWNFREQIANEIRPLLLQKQLKDAKWEEIVRPLKLQNS